MVRASDHPLSGIHWGRPTASAGFEARWRSIRPSLGSFSSCLPSKTALSSRAQNIRPLPMGCTRSCSGRKGLRVTRGPCVRELTVREPTRPVTGFCTHRQCHFSVSPRPTLKALSLVGNAAGERPSGPPSPSVVGRVREASIPLWRPLALPDPQHQLRHQPLGGVPVPQVFFRRCRQSLHNPSASTYVLARNRWKQWRRGRALMTR